jgi:hypothetical protein
MKLKCTSLVLLGLSATVYGAQSAPLTITCTSDSGTQIGIYETLNHQFLAKISQGDSVRTFGVQEEPRDPRMMGAPLVFDGHGFELTINTDALASEKGFPSTFTAHPFGLADETADCILQ